MIRIRLLVSLSLLLAMPCIAAAQQDRSRGACSIRRTPCFPASRSKPHRHRAPRTPQSPASMVRALRRGRDVRPLLSPAQLRNRSPAWRQCRLGRDRSCRHDAVSRDERGRSVHCQADLSQSHRPRRAGNDLIGIAGAASEASSRRKSSSAGPSAAPAGSSKPSPA